MAEQSALGGRKVNRQPNFDRTDIGRVVRNDRYDAHGIIEVVLLDYSKPFPVWVVGDIDRKPMTGDHVLISYINGRKDAPYLVGFLKNKSYTTNFIEVKENRIRIQLPIGQVGVKDGSAHNDTKEHLLKDSKLGGRAYVELTPGHTKVHFPTSEGNPPATVLLTSGSVHINHPGKIIHHGGTREVARRGDTVEVSGTTSDGASFTATGTIVTGSSKTMID